MNEFDLQDKSSTRAVQDSAIARMSADDSAEKGLSEERQQHPLDSADSQALFEQLIACYRQELDRQAANRFQMAIDEAAQVNRDNWQEWRDRWLERYGPTLTVPKMTADQHEYREPLF